jgi:general secretion pathway protein E
MTKSPNPELADAAAQALPACWDLWPVADAMRLGVVVVGDGSGGLRALTPHVEDDMLRAAVRLRVGRPLAWRRIEARELETLLSLGERAYQAMDGVSGAAGDAAGNAADGAELSIQSLSGETSQVVRLLDATLYEALKSGASDLHLETNPQGLTIRYRLDGVMVKVGEVPGRAPAEQLVSRLKVVAGLDIGERRLPQDGRFKRRVGAGGDARDVDFRVSIMPSSFGEDAVVRLLDRAKLAEAHTGLTLDRLGFEKGDAAQILKLATRPYGMLLVTGPTGSGKTTTLYGIVAQTLAEGDKLITIEDPVEYQLPGVVQIPVNEKKGLTFARGLRSVLRHDPDKIMVGEIRDTETAQIASQAALTGHLVLTTVHANNAIDVVGRFMHMGLDLYNVMSSLNGVVAQRLMRKLCTRCAQPFEPDPRQRLQAGLVGVDGNFRRAVGCESCRGTGYHGRRAIAEVLVMDDLVRHLIVSRQPLMEVKAQVKANGTRFLRDAALACVTRGETTLEELDRVTQAD